VGFCLLKGLFNAFTDMRFLLQVAIKKEGLGGEVIGERYIISAIIWQHGSNI
jgi:hypothetical protein